MDGELFKCNPRTYALNLVDDGLVDARQMLRDALNHMSHDEVRDFLEANELGPEDDDEDTDDDAWEDCGSCGGQHPSGYAGDCRNDAMRRP